MHIASCSDRRYVHATRVDFLPFEFAEFNAYVLFVVAMQMHYLYSQKLTCGSATVLYGPSDRLVWGMREIAKDLVS